MSAVAQKRLSNPRKVKPPAETNRDPTAPEPFKFRYDPDANIPLHGCPFVARPSESAVNVGLNFWAVPATTGYEPGWRIGSIMARFFLRAISQDGGACVSGSYLSHIIIDLMERLDGVDRQTEAGMDEHYSLRGQLYGFLKTIEHAARCGARDHAKEFTQFDVDKALRLANAGLILDEKAYQDKRARMHRLKEQMAAMPGAEIMAGNSLELLLE
ncbi:hypothetical protein ISN75_02505 [Dyella marensis]|uniref:hypothetical protein n=1 Tax=Dyella marensis TaxID=500610 RepID=UPI0031D8EDB0